MPKEIIFCCSEFILHRHFSCGALDKITISKILISWLFYNVKFVILFKDVYLSLINIIICLMSVLPLCFDFHIHSKCNVFIESLINHIPNQNNIESENCINTKKCIDEKNWKKFAKNDYWHWQFNILSSVQRHLNSFV